MEGLPRRFLERLPDAVLHVRVAQTAHILVSHPGYLPEGLIRRDMAGQDIADVLPDSAATTLTTACRQALAQRTHVAVVISLTSAADKAALHYLEAHVSPYAAGEVLCVLHDITEQRLTEQRLIRRELYLSALTQINHRLLAARGDDLPYSEDTLSLLGYAAGASVVYALELAASDAEDLTVRDGLVWVAQGHEAALDASAPVTSLARRLLPEWFVTLRRGRPVQVSVAELSEDEVAILSQRAPGVQVLLLLPILVGDVFVGLLGFENHGRERRWADDEVSMLQAAAVAVSSHIEHTLYVRQLRSHAEEIARMNVELAEARDQAQVSDRAKSEFLAVMGHEMRTPLNAVISMTEMLRRTELSEQQQRFVDLSHEAGISLLDRINTILDYVDVQAGSLVPHDVIFSPAAVVRSAVQLYEGKAQEKSLSLEMRLDPGLPAAVRGDAIRVRQVLISLVDNALKFTERGGVTVRVGVEAHAGEPAPDRVVLRFSVADTGIGLAPRARDELFEPFVQGDTSSTRRFNGSGLGLALAKRIVTSLGGVLDVRSRPRGGSTFWFTVDVARSTSGVGDRPSWSALPVESVSGGAASVLPEAKKATDPTIHVLLVERNAILRRLAAQELERQGCRVSAVATPAEAQRALRVVRSVDVALLELPPELGPGAERAATADVRALEILLAALSRAGAPRPLLVGLTGQPGRAAQAACDGVGLDLCMAKPLTSTAVRELLSRCGATPRTPV